MTKGSAVPALRPAGSDHDAAIAAAEQAAIVVWRGRRIGFLELRSRIAGTDDRNEREGMFASWIEALEALQPLYRDRYRAGREEAAATASTLEELALELEQLAIQSETVYYAALRRFLALIGIEQGDATLADQWHLERGSSWSQWFGERDLANAVAEAGRRPVERQHDAGWRAAEAGLAGSDGDPRGPAAAVDELFASLAGDPSWLRHALGMADSEIASFADFAAFVRLWRVRRSIAEVQYEIRLYATTEESLQRAYFSGIVGHLTGIGMPEAAYLHDVARPFSSVADIERRMLAGAMAERLESRFGSDWWAIDEARAVTAQLAGAPSVRDALAQLGYDDRDWRPLLRQIRARLIGEMSGYGGPNITTRAGTRKV